VMLKTILTSGLKSDGGALGPGRSGKKLPNSKTNSVCVTRMFITLANMVFKSFPSQYDSEARSDDMRCDA
jgi:hypothetical protein